MTETPLRVCIIVNPVSGVNRSALEQIQAFVASHPELTVEFRSTERAGDATRFAREAVASGVDVVAAYGGDGTMMETAEGLRSSDVPLLILPGGTANVMAVELGIGFALDQALALLTAPERPTRVVDMGSVDNETFLLRVGIGYEAEATAATARGDKLKAGRIAYFRNALRKIRRLRPTRYVITVDGVAHVQRGITCMICNSSNIGIPNLRLVNASNVSDGMLDVIVIDSIRPGSILRVLLSILVSAAPTGANPRLIAHWQGREITVATKSRQLVARDGEVMKRAKRISARVQPGALRVIVPPATLSEEELNDVGTLDPDPSAVRAASGAGRLDDAASRI